jgi:Holliday junction resolvasome RuvABC endonuclease subunit
MDPPTIFGIDYSMTCPAVCVAYNGQRTCYAWPSSYNGEEYIDNPAFSVRVLPNVLAWAYPIDRFDQLARKVLFPLNKFEGTQPIVYIEGYSMGSKGQTFHIAENTAILKHYFHRVGIEVREVAPTTVKKFATGSGRAQKEDMYDAFVAKTGIQLQGMLTPKRKKLGSPVSDIVDAFFIAEYGRAHYHEDEETGRSGIVSDSSPG